MDIYPAGPVSQLHIPHPIWEGFPASLASVVFRFYPIDFFSNRYKFLLNPFFTFGV